MPTAEPGGRQDEAPDAVVRAWSERGADYAVSAPHTGGPSLAKLLALAHARPGDRCLDIGTGAGHTAAGLAATGALVIGLDPARGMLDAARERYGHLANLGFVEASGSATGFEDDAFDIVTARHTLHHHIDPAATLSEVARVLRPGGRFILVDEATPDAACDAWLDAVERARDATHVRAYTMPEWRSMLETAGLNVIAGDLETEYVLDVRSWVERMHLPSNGAAEVARLFRDADAHQRERFSIVYEAGEAVRFNLPMALVLACKPAAPLRSGVAQEGVTRVGAVPSAEPDTPTPGSGRPEGGAS